jgi:SAM-dependent methyltransferase
MPINYDPIARSYDFLSRLVFGQAETKAQIELLRYTNAGSRILVVGGGTGWILEELATLHPAGLRITYVDSSARMIAASKKRAWGENEVAFVQMPAEEFARDGQPAAELQPTADGQPAVDGQPAADGQIGPVYDSILTGFFFDNFSDAMAANVFNLLNPLLKPGGHWLYTDFFCHRGQGKLWQRLMLKSMYWSARLVCQVEGRELTDTEPLFAAAGYRQVYTSFHYGRFIKSIGYQKMKEAN